MQDLVEELHPLVGKCSTFTSNDLKSLFQGKKLSPKFSPFQGKYKRFYSEREPDVVITYTWKTCLLSELPKFLDEFEVLIGSICTMNNNSLTYWIDIFFVDQNEPDIVGALEKVERIYQRARFHAVFMSKSCFRRGWCLFEVAIRLKAVMDSYGESRQSENGKNHMIELITQRNIINNGHVTVPVLVIIPEHNDSITSLIQELLELDDLYSSMVTSEVSDKKHIQDRICRTHGSADAFNSLVLMLALAEAARFLSAHPTNPGIGQLLRWVKRDTARHAMARRIIPTEYLDLDPYKPTFIQEYRNARTRRAVAAIAADLTDDYHTVAAWHSLSCSAGARVRFTLGTQPRPPPGATALSLNGERAARSRGAGAFQLALAVALVAAAGFGANFGLCRMCSGPWQ